MKDNYKKITKVVVTLMFLGLVLSQIEFHDFSRKLLNLSPFHIIGALLFLILQSFIVSTRWMMIVKKISRPIAYGKILKAHYLSLSSSLILPNIVAEPAVKAYLLKKDNVPISDTISSVIIDKLFVLIGLSSLTIAVSPSIFFLYPETRHWLYIYVLLVTFLLLSQLLIRLDLVGRLFGKKRVLRDKFEKYVNTFKYLLFDEQLIIPCLSLSFISQLFAICAVFILTLPMDPGLSFYQCVLLMPPVMLATAVPIAFNGWGVRELAMIYVLGFANISSEAALALSIQFGTIGLLLWSIGLIFWIPVKGKDYEGT